MYVCVVFGGFIVCVCMCLFCICECVREYEYVWLYLWNVFGHDEVVHVEEQFHGNPELKQVVDHLLGPLPQDGQQVSIELWIFLLWNEEKGKMDRGMFHGKSYRVVRKNVFFLSNIFYRVSIHNLFFQSSLQPIPWMYRVFIKYCVFSFKCCDFSELCQFCCSAGFLPAWCVYTH